MKSIFLLFLFLISFQSQASVFLEPQVGYSYGSFSGETNDPGLIIVSQDIKGLSYGAKAGVQWGVLQIGADYLQTKFKDEEGDSDTMSEIAGLLGLRFNWFRMYGGFIFDAKSEDQEGDGTKFGLTFYALTHLALNLEYRKITYDQEKMAGFTVDTDYSAVALMASVPFDIID